MTVMVQVVLGPWLNKKCDKTISTAWNDNIALGYETEARDRERKGTLDRIHEQQPEQKPRVQGRKEGVRRPASDDRTWHRGVLGWYPGREIQRDLARRARHRHTLQPRRKRAIERILYALAKLLLLQGLEAGITHRRAALRDPLLEPTKRPADATLHDAETQHRSTVYRVLLRVTCELERDRPRPRHRDEREATFVEDRLRSCAEAIRRREEDRVVYAPLWATSRGVIEEVHHQHVKASLTEGNENHGALEGPGERHICVVVHPIRAEAELVSGLRNAHAESLLG